jgi:hypothetical protein
LPDLRDRPTCIPCRRSAPEAAIHQILSSARFLCVRGEAFDTLDSASSRGRKFKRLNFMLRIPNRRMPDLEEDR